MGHSIFYLHPSPIDVLGNLRGSLKSSLLQGNSVGSFGKLKGNVC